MTWRERWMAARKTAHAPDHELPKLPKAPFGSFGRAFSEGERVSRDGDGWTAADWREHFAERVAVAMIDGGQPEPQAREMARESCIVRWLDLHPVTSAPGRCAHCGEPETRGAAIVPYGTGPHAWLHPRCWPAWSDRRRREAERALAAVGIGR
jgi:hypothetical protein